jgi:tetratricopeptide (TPR) repeat protein
MRAKILMLLALLFALPAVLFLGCLRGVDLEISQKFQAAQEAFDRAAGPDDFRRVAAMYQEILDRGVRSGAVLFNQGNAWMNAGNPGRAVAAYRQAQRYRPTDPFLDANLRYALGEEAAAAARRPLIEHILFWQNWLSYPAKFYLAAVGATVTLTFGVLALFAWPVLFRRLALATLVLSGLLVFSAAYDWYRFDHVRHGVVVADQVIARKGNADTYQPAFTEPMPEGAEFRVLGQRGSWLLIRLPAQQEAWIPSDAAVVY